MRNNSGKHHCGQESKCTSNMARLVSVYDSDSECELQRRQIPIEVDNMKMVVQFSDKCVDCERLCGIRQRDLEQFTNKFNTLTKDEVAVALLVSGKDIMSLLSHMVPCVGCRKSVERLFTQLQKSQHPALEPLVITPRGEMSIQHEYLFDPRSLFSLFHVHGSKLHSVVESIPKSKKNKRCNLHSLDTHKSRTLGCWLDAWDALSESCREKVLVVDMNRLLTTVDTYLDKHKFCSECKSKVLLAYTILIGEQDSATEKGYCAALYENLRCCPKERHIHVLNDTDFIAHLLEKAEPEFLGGKRDRHAKTLDIAQEEVLTCIGIHIFERLHSIWQKLRGEEQTWLMLFYMGVDTLRKSYQMALEEKQGASNLELLCEELLEKEKRQEEKKELKRQKRRLKKAKVTANNSTSAVRNGQMGPHEILLDEIPCSCSSLELKDKRPKGSNKNNNCHTNFHFSSSTSGSCSIDANFNSLTVSLQGCSPECQKDHDPESVENGNCGKGSKENWKSSNGELDSCESCSTHGSNECSEECECSGSFTDCVESCGCDMLTCSPKRGRGLQSTNFPNCLHEKFTFHAGDHPSLQDLLEDVTWRDEGDDDELGISEEDILAFKAQQVEVESQRLKLRQNLRQRFEQLYMSQHVNIA
ncbi:hypothetical protein EGW08_009866 [Elysia chlorotica]|uniref:Gametogenetin-binding protein 2 n=1 Tax=Elysia chlorotica TaxID=188477 RepID=A0A3S1B8J8_ELYCH|nr:hypothetical protein EGW08_009866 [Elysia chlorotica]